jgi:TPR repeat protein
MLFKILMLLGAPIVIMALCTRPAFALAMDAEQNYQKGLELYLKCEKEKDPTGAAVFFKQAAEQGHSDAAFGLGVLYQNGEGVAQNIPEAVKWYTKAAFDNHAKAQFNLGHLLFEGIGITRDQSTAVSWFQKAADQGYAKAQYKVGCAYLTGEGVPQNQTLAIAWLDRAATQGDKEAIHTLKLVRELHASKS